MKNILAISVALFALASMNTASAADLPVKSSPPASSTPAAYDWTGWYVGANVGYGWNNEPVTLAPNDTLTQFVTCAGNGGGACPPATSLSAQGALGGLQVGYNWRMNPNLILGLEADFDWASIKGSGAANFPIDSGAAPTTATHVPGQNVDWFGTVRARVGASPVDRTLLYATGGFAYGKIAENEVVRNSLSASGNGVFAYDCTISGPNCFVGSTFRTAIGSTAGGGAEYAFSNSVILRAEYLFISLAGDSFVAPTSAAVAAPFAPASFVAGFGRTELNIVRGGNQLQILTASV